MMYLGRGTVGAQNAAALRKKIYERGQSKGYTPEDIATRGQEFKGLGSAETALGTRSATVEMAVQEAQNLMPQVLETSKSVNRSNYPALNKIIEAAQSHTGDPNIVRFGTAINSLVNVYARAISPTGVPTDQQRQHAYDILDKAWSGGQIEAAVDQMNKEMEAARKSPGQVRDSLRSGYVGKSESGVPKAQPTPAQLQLLEQNKDNPEFMQHWIDRFGQ